MKPLSLAQKSLYACLLTAFLGTSILAKSIDVSKSQKDIRVMSKILETSLESSSKEFPGKPKIKGTYLANQGYLFTIQLNGLGRFGIPGLATWEDGSLELDIPEIVSSALSNVDIDDEYLEYMPDGFEETLDSAIVESEIKQEKLRELRDRQRAERKELYKLKRKLRRAVQDQTRAEEDQARAEREKARAELEKQVVEKEKSLQTYQSDYKKTLDSYKKERINKRVTKSNAAIKSIFQSVCDYGQSMRALKSSEWVTLIVKGGVNKEGKSANLVFVINQKDVRNCSNSKSLQTNSVQYSI